APSRGENAGRPAQGVRDRIEALPVQSSVTMFVGAGGNVAVQAGPQGVLLVDTGAASMTRKLLAEVGQLSNKALRYAINTTADADHTGGNEAIANLNGPVTSLPVQNTPGSTLTQSAQIIAHDNVNSRMTARKDSAAALPGESFVNDEKELYFNGEAIRIYHVP